MRVIHLSSSDISGGAAIAALRIHLSLRSKINSTMFVARKNKNYPDVFSYKSDLMKIYSYFKIAMGKSISKLQKTRNKSLHSTSCLPSKLDHTINSSTYDIVHLHWIQGEMISIEAIGRINKPIIWTLHDNWAFLGSEHLPSDKFDIRYQNGYTKENKPNGHKLFDLDRWCWERKKKNWSSDINIVCPSKWLADCARNSALMKNWNIKIIPHPIDIKLFKPYPKEISRELFKLPKNKKIILFGAIDGTLDPNKGWDLLEKALKIIYNEIPNSIAVVFGKSFRNNKNKINMPIYFTGRINNEKSLAMLYSSADVMVVPSRCESFSQTASEATSCGTPVVGFNYSGIKDVVSNNKTGYLVEPYDYKELAKGILELIKNDEKLNNFKIDCRAKAIKYWNQEIVSKMYYDFYKEIKS